MNVDVFDVLMFVPTSRVQKILFSSILAFGAHSIHLDQKKKEGEHFHIARYQVSSFRVAR